MVTNPSWTLAGFELGLHIKTRSDLYEKVVKQTKQAPKDDPAGDSNEEQTAEPEVTTIREAIAASDSLSVACVAPGFPDSAVDQLLHCKMGDCSSHQVRHSKEIHSMFRVDIRAPGLQ